MTAVHHRMTIVDGHSLFHREAGPKGAPAVVLLHGYPSSSHMFRNLIPQLADRYRVIAPDYLGFGLSDAPSVDDFDYTFDALADLVDKQLDELGVERAAFYVQDYGAPVGWRLAAARPERVTGLISQNGNAYTGGFVEDFWKAVWAYGENPTDPAAEAAIRGALSLEAIHWQYTHGVPDVSLVDPQAWLHDTALVNRPGNDLVQLTLFRDYVNNVGLYPKFQEYFRTSQPPLLAVWGANDEIFGPDGARAFSADLPDAEVHLLNGGHFLLESHLDAVAGYIRGFLGRVLS